MLLANAAIFFGFWPRIYALCAIGTVLLVWTATPMIRLRPSFIMFLGWLLSVAIFLLLAMIGLDMASNQLWLGVSILLFWLIGMFLEVFQALKERRYASLVM
jgi:hypothetical protein